MKVIAVPIAFCECIYIAFDIPNRVGNVRGSLGIDISRGEGYNLEFKEKLSENHKKFLKTVVAFANGVGGRIIFGVDDKKNIIGIPDEELYGIRDDITSAVCDSVEPVPSFSVDPATVGGRTVLVLTVDRGREVPYYLKSEGNPKGVYVRFSATTRQAGDTAIQQLLLRGSGISFDAVESFVECDDDKIAVLCEHLNRAQYDIRLLMNRSTQEVAFDTKVLLSLGVIKESRGSYVGTNAFALLTENPFYGARIQCLRFAGTEGRELLDSKEYTGDIITQTIDAIRFVRDILRTGSTFVGIGRIDTREIPDDVVREAVVNAVLHRDYSLIGARIFVRVYPGRVEIETPGIPIGLDPAFPEESYSALRNPVLAGVFKVLGLFDGYGTGIGQMFDKCRENGNEPPYYRTMTNGISTVLTRKSVSDSSNLLQEKGTQSDFLSLTDIERVILNQIVNNPRITRSEISARTGVSPGTVSSATQKLKKIGLLTRRGTSRTGEWVVNNHQK